MVTHSFIHLIHPFDIWSHVNDNIITVNQMDKIWQVKLSMLDWDKVIEKDKEAIFDRAFWEGDQKGIVVQTEGKANGKVSQQGCNYLFLRERKRFVTRPQNTRVKMLQVLSSVMSSSVHGMEKAFLV